MALKRQNPKRDIVESEIISVAKQMGCSVLQLSEEGCPDLLVGVFSAVKHAYLNLLVECKSKKGKLTPSQEEFFNSWQGQCVVIHSAEEMKDYLDRVINSRSGPY